jgi:IS1 family transposase/transposase-like protein
MNKPETTPTNKLTCPQCGLSHIKKNGHTYYGKQNYRCNSCGRQFVIRNKTVSKQKKELVNKLLLERIALRGICRVLDVSRCWLHNYIERLYQRTAADLNFQIPDEPELQLLLVEADEVWSFVGNKENKRWIWLILERRTRQIIAVHIGDRSEKSAKALWKKVPLQVKLQALVLTDHWDAYGLAIPSNQHTACSKQSGQVSLIERFNCTLRQRVSRLVRKSLSFSKSEWFHEKAIKYFLAYYNLKCQEKYFST